MWVFYVATEILQHESIWLKATEMSAASRYLRLDTKGSSELHMFYVKHAAELPVITALAKKGGVMKETTEQQVQAGVVFPGDYPHKDMSQKHLTDF